MQGTTGTIDCQGAVFIYKNDPTAARAWQVAQGIAHVRAEVHDDRSQFLAGLKAWNTYAQRDPTNAFLAIYSHMGTPGLSPKGNTDSHFKEANIVSWADLAGALPRGVETVWLVGCKSDAIMNAWPSGGPVLGYALVTLDSALWLPLLPLFAAEISIGHIRSYGEMASFIAQQLVGKGRHKQASSIRYYARSPTGWRPFPLCLTQKVIAAAQALLAQSAAGTKKPV